MVARQPQKVVITLCRCGCGKRVRGGKLWCKGHQFTRDESTSDDARRDASVVKKQDAKSPAVAEAERLREQRESIDGIGFKAIGISPDLRARLRLKAQTDLYWLCTQVLDIPLVERVHRPVCEFLVHKDPSIPLADWDHRKKRMYLLSRNSFKSTIAVADLIQTLLCDPNARILIMRATLRLAHQMLDELRGHFTSNAKMRVLFPEHCWAKLKDSGDRDTFMSKARKSVLREPSVSVGTVESNKVGLHCDVLLLDDLVNDLNSRTSAGRDKVATAYQLLTPITEAWGYTTIVGTPYHVSDLYANLRSYAESHPDEWSVMIRGAWTLKPGAEANSTNESDYDLWYPERLSFDVLQKARSEMTQAGLGYLFTNQYLCEPTSNEDGPRFSDALLRSHTLPPAECHIGAQGSAVIQFWDFAFGGRGINPDYTAAVTAILNDGKVYIVDAVRDRFTPSALAQRMVEFAARWSPVRIGVEKANGAPFLLPAIEAAAQQSRIPMQISWVDPPRGKGAKAARILSIEGWLSADRLYFSAAMPHLDDLYAELSVAGSARGHDDLSDALSYALLWCGDGGAPSAKLQRFHWWRSLEAPKARPDYGASPVLGYGLNG